MVFTLPNSWNAGLVNFQSYFFLDKKVAKTQGCKSLTKKLNQSGKQNQTSLRLSSGFAFHSLQFNFS